MAMIDYAIFALQNVSKFIFLMPMCLLKLTLPKTPSEPPAKHMHHLAWETTSRDCGSPVGVLSVPIIVVRLGTRRYSESALGKGTAMYNEESLR